MSSQNEFFCREVKFETGKTLPVRPTVLRHGNALPTTRHPDVFKKAQPSQAHKLVAGASCQILRGKIDETRASDVLRHTFLWPDRSENYYFTEANGILLRSSSRAHGAPNGEPRVAIERLV